MILTFGYIAMHVQMDLDNPLAFPCAINAKGVRFQTGGAALNQAVAAARSGAKASVIGAIGKDLCAKQILETLRREGIQTAGIAKSDRETGLINTLIDQEGKEANIFSNGANIHSASAQIPDYMFNEKNLLLLQNDLVADIHMDLLKRAAHGKAVSIMSFAHGENIDLDFFKYIDIAIIKETILPDLRDTLESAENQHYLILKKESVAYRGTTTQCSVDLTNKTATFDSFCGTFAACTQARLAPDKALTYALSAATLTATTNIFPYLGEIEENMQPPSPRSCAAR